MELMYPKNIVSNQICITKPGRYFLYYWPELIPEGTIIIVCQNLSQNLGI